MIIRIQLLLLSFGVGLSAAREFQGSSNGSFGTTGRVTNKFEQTMTAEPNLTRAPMNETTQNENSNTFSQNGEQQNRTDLRTTEQNHRPQQNNQGISNKSIPDILRRLNICRERYFKRYNRTAAGLTHRGRAGLGRNSSISVFHCNISKELVDGLKDKLHQLELFQDIIVLYPKSRSSNVDHLSASKAQGEMKKYHKSFLPKKDKNFKERRERDALLKNDQIESNTKVLQLSHIYLGRSLYPLFTEESRIIGRDHTLPPPVYTGRINSYVDKKWTTPGAYK